LASWCCGVDNNQAPWPDKGSGPWSSCNDLCPSSIKVTVSPFLLLFVTRVVIQYFGCGCRSSSRRNNFCIGGNDTVFGNPALTIFLIKNYFDILPSEWNGIENARGVANWCVLVDARVVVPIRQRHGCCHFGIFL